MDLVKLAMGSAAPSFPCHINRAAWRFHFSEVGMMREFGLQIIYSVRIFFTMIESRIVTVGNSQFEFFRMNLGKAPLLILKGKKGYVMCGYLDISTPDKLGELAARVTGVKSLEDVLGARIAQVSKSLKEMGVEEGTPVTEALQFLA